MEVIDVTTKDKNKAADEAIKESLPTDSRRPLRVGAFVMLLGFGGFLAWAALAPIDSGVTAMGSVALDGRRKTVQHLSGGVVKQILVREGEQVKEGDLLIRMDDSMPLAAKSMAEAELKSLDVQIRFLEQLIGDLKSMSEEGFYPRNRFLELQKQLAEAQTRQSGIRDRVAAANLELRRTVITSPSSGNVMGLSVTTEGAVIPSGGKLLEVVPADERLVVEAQIEPHMIDKVVPGLVAEVRFSALNLRSTPITVGTVEWVSGDKFMNPQDAMHPMGYYTARIIVTADEIKKIGSDVVIRPGMPADVIFKTGERTFLQYLIKPLTDRMATSLKEQ